MMIISCMDTAQFKITQLNSCALTSGAVWSIHLKIAAELTFGSGIFGITGACSVTVISIITLFDSKRNLQVMCS